MRVEGGPFQSIWARAARGWSKERRRVDASEGDRARGLKLAVGGRRDRRRRLPVLSEGSGWRQGRWDDEQGCRREDVGRRVGTKEGREAGRQAVDDRVARFSTAAARAEGRRQKKIKGGLGRRLLRGTLRARAFALSPSARGAISLQPPSPRCACCCLPCARRRPACSPSPRNVPSACPRRLTDPFRSPSRRRPRCVRSGARLPSSAPVVLMYSSSVALQHNAPLGPGRYIETAAMLVIGDEVLNGKTTDTNSSASLPRLGCSPALDAR